MSRLLDKQALKRWEALRKSIATSTTVDVDETVEEQEKRKKKLEKSFPDFCKYYFPKYYKSEFAAFQKEYAQHVIDNNVTVAVAAWARDHAKSVIVDIMLTIYLHCTGRASNTMLVSRTETVAIDLLTPIQIQFEKNQRLINDYGVFQSMTKWESGFFKTNQGWAFKALGSGQNPRGAREEDIRPDHIIVDDIDDDELARNSKRLDELNDWVWGALMPCFHISGSQRFQFVGNIIAKDSIIQRALLKADFKQIINILDEKGIPSWKEAYTIGQCQRMIDKLGYRLSQREYFNNPISEGKVFKKEWMQFKQLPPLKAYKNFALAYLDPGFKKTKTSDTKALVLVGLIRGEWHIIKVFCGKASVEEMIAWCYEMDKYVKEKGGAYKLKMEEVFLQDLLYKDFNAAAKARNYAVPVTGDKRKKPDKDARIEATSGYFERGTVYFNEGERDNHHMQALIEQYLNFETGVRTKKDGPDAVEGAMHLLEQTVMQNGEIYTGERHVNKHRA